jgi:hypothetical protein
MFYRALIKSHNLINESYTTKLGYYWSNTYETYRILLYSNDLKMYPEISYIPSKILFCECLYTL